MNVDFKIGKHVGMVVTDLKEPDLTEGMSDEELFSVINHSDLESEKITAPRYSYWQSVFRVFFRKKINIVMLSLLGIIILMAYLYPIFVEYDKFGNLLNASAKHLTPKAAIDKFGYFRYGHDLFGWFLDDGVCDDDYRMAHDRILYPYTGCHYP